MTDIRVTREAIEVLAEVTTTPDVRTTRIAIEVLHEKGAEPEPPSTALRRTLMIIYT